MNRMAFVFSVLSVMSLLTLTGCKTEETQFVDQQRDNLIDTDWKFSRNDSTGFEYINFDDSKWRTLDLPHDWSIEDLPEELMRDSTSVGPFSKKSIGAKNTGNVVGGIGWYRKHFVLADENKDKTVILRFDGVYNQSDVWLNGTHLGFHAYGYTPFNYDISKLVNRDGKPNIIAVKVKNEGVNSRWYSGSGIYRHVWLTVTNKIHIPVWGVCVTSSKSENQSSLVNIKVKVKNDNAQISEVQIKTHLYTHNGDLAGERTDTVTIAAQGLAEIFQQIEVDKAVLWSPANPHLYKASIKVYSGEKKIDSTTQNFGIRFIDFSTQNGFLLNGESVKLKGACIHNDNGILGSATYNRAEERKIELLKKNGFNAIRTSHNPPSQQLLDACDRLGMLVMDEAFDMWEYPKKPDDYSRYFKEWWQRDLESMMLRDRNHPSIVIWSFGNEIHERADTSGMRIAKQLVDFIHKYDTSRPVTQAIYALSHDSLVWSRNLNAFKYLDVGGYNYQHIHYISDHKKYPDRIILGTESVAKELFQLWKLVEKEPYVIGDFVWTGIDYLGETGIGNTQYINKNEEIPVTLPWPWFNAWCGDIDICGRKKPQSFYRDVIWDLSKIEMAVHAPIPAGKVEKLSYWGWPDEMQSWNWPVEEGTLMKVAVYTKCSKVRLELNGEVLEVKSVNADSAIAVEFSVPYRPGELKAYGLNDGNVIASKSLVTAGSAKKIKLTADRTLIRPDRNDLAFITVDITDEKGVSLPDAKIPITIKVSGNGELLAAGNGSPNEMDSFKQAKCNTFRGQALVVLRPFTKNGKINLVVESNGLQSGTINIDVNETKQK